MVKTFDFHQQKAMSERPKIYAAVREAVRKQFPDVLAIHKAHVENDKRGIDYWLEFAGGKMETLDVKIREKDWALRGDKDNICLELASDEGRGKPGWSLDETKLTDWVLFYWEESGHAEIYPARMVRGALQAKRKEWESTKKTAGQVTRTDMREYMSRSIFVSGRDIWRAMFERYALGKPNDATRNRESR